MSRVNPFEKHLGPEDHLQHQFIVWLGYSHPFLKFHHSPDSGKRTIFERFKYKYLGSDAGFPDLQFPTLLHVIELKVAPNKPTAAQNEWLDYLRANGWTADVCYSFDEACASIKRVLDLKSLKMKQ